MAALREGQQLKLGADLIPTLIQICVVDRLARHNNRANVESEASGNVLTLRSREDHRGRILTTDTNLSGGIMAVVRTAKDPGASRSRHGRSGQNHEC